MIAVSVTVYECPLCHSTVHREADEPMRFLRRGRVVVETPLGRAIRIEGIVERHMMDEHGLDAGDAVKVLRQFWGE